MLTVTPPIALTDDSVWVFVSATNTDGVDAARLAYADGADRFVALPADAFNTTGPFPIYPGGKPFEAFRWANTTDVDTHAEQFAD